MDDILHNHDDNINHVLHQLTLQECNTLFSKQEVNTRIFIGKRSTLQRFFKNLQYTDMFGTTNNKYIYVL
jgi:hypothetical protein